MPVPQPSRRSVLALAGVGALGLLAGCTGGDDGPDPPGGKGAEPDPDLALLARAIADKQDLVASYAATTARHPALSARLEPLQEDHAAHLAALTGVRPDLPAAVIDPAISPAPSASASPTGTTIPADRAAAVEALAKAELAAAGRRIGQCGSARAAELARLLASIGGCEASHTAVLRAGGGS